MRKYDWLVPTRKELTEILDGEQVEQITVKVAAELLEPMLGTVPNNKQLLTDYITEKMGDFQGHPIKDMAELEEEIESCPEDGETPTTGFHKDVFGIFIYNYMIVGNIKANIYCLMCNGFGKVLNYKKSADLFIKVNPRKIRFYRDDEDTPLMQPDGAIERSIRAQTAKGERTFLAKSDIVNAGTRFKFEVTLFRNDKGLTPEFLVQALKFGKNNGLGQWRGSGGYGKYKILTLKYV